MITHAVHPKTANGDLAQLVADFCSGELPKMMRVGKRAKQLTQEECQHLAAAIKAAGRKPSPAILAHAKGFDKQPEVLSLPEQAQREEQRRLEDQRHLPGMSAALARAKNGKSSKIIWSEDDWAFVASKVLRLRLEQPTTSLTDLVAGVMQEMPAEIRRKPASVLTQLGPRLKQHGQRWLDLEAECELLKEQLASQPPVLDREEILSTVTREEICQRYADVVLEGFTADDLCSKFSLDEILSCLPTSALMAAALSRTLENFTQQAKDMHENTSMLGRILADMPAEKLHRQQAALAAASVALPKIALVGFKSDQGAFIADALRGRAKIEVIDKNRSRFESQAEIVMIWTRFISHSMQDNVRKYAKPGAQIILHNGYDEGGRGLKAAIAELERVLAK